jgi:hypothetical protein
MERVQDATVRALNIRHVAATWQHSEVFRAYNQALQSLPILRVMTSLPQIGVQSYQAVHASLTARG